MGGNFPGGFISGGAFFLAPVAVSVGTMQLTLSIAIMQVPKGSIRKGGVDLEKGGMTPPYQLCYFLSYRSQ